MLRILILSCSRRRESKSRVLALKAQEFLHKQGVDTRLVDMQEISLPDYAGEDSQSVAVQQLTGEIAWANGVIIATPIYNWSVNSVVKKVVEATGADETGRKVRAWEDKVVTFLCCAGVPQAYLAYLPTANSLMVDYKCIINPHIVFALRSDIEEGKIANVDVAKRLERVLAISVELTDALKDRKLPLGLGIIDTMARSAFFYTDDYRHYHLSDHHPLQQRRILMLDRLLAAYGVFDRGEVDRVAPTPATESDIRTCHSEDFIHAVKAAGAGEWVPELHRYGLGAGDTPAFPGIWDASLLYVGASIDCAKAVLEGSRISAFNPSGGLHHAFRTRAAGFCTFNDCAIAAHTFLNAGKKVAYLDIVDAHAGDGVQALFYADPRVLTISFHETGRTLFPGTGFPEEIGEGEGKGYSINVPLAPYSTDDHYQAAFHEVAEPALAAFDPDFIILQVGADAHWQDPLAHLMLTSYGWLSLVQKVIALDKPLIALGGGGYNQKTVARLWTLLQASLAGIALPDETPAGYAAEWGITHLHDQEKPAIAEADREQAWHYLTDCIENLRRLGVVGLGG